MTDVMWNPWHGCVKYSEGCKNCYVYRRDGSVGRDASDVRLNAGFTAPLDKARDGEYKIPAGTRVYACMTSDFFLDRADQWRGVAWDVIRRRPDLRFTIITKRILRFADCVPFDWGDGWEHVTVCCTVENQRRADERLPVFLNAPIKHKCITCEPLLGPLELRRYLTPEIELLLAGGESGNEARPCDFDWVLDMREQAHQAGVRFYFKQTGANFIKDGRHYRIPRALQHKQAKLAFPRDS